MYGEQLRPPEAQMMAVLAGVTPPLAGNISDTLQSGPRCRPGGGVSVWLSHYALRRQATADAGMRRCLGKYCKDRLPSLLSYAWWEGQLRTIKSSYKKAYRRAWCSKKKSSSSCKEAMTRLRSCRDMRAAAQEKKSWAEPGASIPLGGTSVSQQSL